MNLTIICFRLFESVVKYFDAFLNMIPLSFVLGFYVSYVASRWWQQVKSKAKAILNMFRSNILIVQSPVPRDPLAR